MNTNRIWIKILLAVFAVGLAGFFTARFALADHITPVEGVPVSSQTTYDQYQAVLEHMEEGRLASLLSAFDAAEGVPMSRKTYVDHLEAAADHMEESRIASLLSAFDRRISSLYAIGQDRAAALVEIERQHQAQFNRLPVSAISSAAVFDQYQAAMEEMRREQAAMILALSTRNSASGSE